MADDFEYLAGPPSASAADTAARKPPKAAWTRQPAWVKAWRTLLVLWAIPSFQVGIETRNLWIGLIAFWIPTQTAASIAAFRQRPDLFRYLIGRADPSNRHRVLRPGRERLAGLSFLVGVVTGSWIVIDTWVTGTFSFWPVAGLPIQVVILRAATERYIDPRRAIRQHGGSPASEPQSQGWPRTLVDLLAPQLPPDSGASTHWRTTPPTPHAIATFTRQPRQNPSVEVQISCTRRNGRYDSGLGDLPTPTTNATDSVLCRLLHQQRRHEVTYSVP